MDYFKVNYHRLANLNQIKYFYFVIFVLILIFVIIFFSFKIRVSKVLNSYGIYHDGVLTIKIQNKLSDIIINNNMLSFDNKDTKYLIQDFGDYEIINDDIYQEINLIVDEKFYENEIGVVKVRYEERRIIKHILKLLK